MGWTEQELIAKGFRVQGTHASRTPQDASRGQDDVQARDLPESSLLARVRRCALDNGWLFYHTFSSRRSTPGYPDVCCAKPGHPLLLLELKTERGKLTQEQVVWLEFLGQTTGTHVAVYRPSQWPLIEHLLSRRAF